jgi:hypothetical protein
VISETGCNSWGAKKHVKCPHSHRCVIDVNDCFQDDNKPRSNNNETSCPLTLSGQEQWRCDDGLCILNTFVCDGYKNCADGTDETDGCNLYPSTGCASWKGEKHIKCPGNGTICTVPEFVDNCRSCHNENHWRCNSGWCIDKDKVGNGVPECLDGSDERASKMKKNIMPVKM